MRSKLLPFLSLALVLPLALTSRGDSRPSPMQAAETEMRVALASVKSVTADALTGSSLLVVNPSNTPVMGVAPADASGAAFAPYSGYMAWGTSVGVTSSAGIRGLAAVAPDNSGYIAVVSSGGTTGTQISGNFGVRTFAGDLAEAFPASAAEPGSVMSIDPARPGALVVAREPYDRRVAGVVAGAKDYAPGVTLRGLAEIQGVTVTLSGTTYCLASDVNGPIRAGDLLTTSSVPGHAMRASDLDRARGAILGKAMEDLKGSRGHVLILASLQ
jgi:hypothetical protein